MKKVKNLDCILFIDDDEITNFFHVQLIEGLGLDVQVEVVSNGKEALEFITKTGKYKDSTSPEPGILFLDLNMPVMNGWEFLDEYSKLVDLYTVKKRVIMMLPTSKNPDEKDKALSERYLADYYAKPLTAEMVLRAIDQFEKSMSDE